MYVDDHLVMLKGSKAEVRFASGPDRDAIETSRQASLSAGLPRAPEKGFGFAKDSPESAPSGDEVFSEV